MSTPDGAMDPILREALRTLGHADQQAEAWKSTAQMTFAMFKANVDAGFTVSQSLQLTGTIMGTFLAQAAAQGKPPE